jgi:lycopene beta-cyclase
VVGSNERITRHVCDGAEAASLELADGRTMSTRFVVDATGAPTADPSAWQTAYGVVVNDATAARLVPTDAVTLMDWWADGDVPMFLYAVPLSSGWLIEATVLASRQPVEVARLRARLAERLGDAVVAGAEHAGMVETVRIPMGAPVRRGSGCVVRFGAAGGMIHPATGHSVGAALRAAPRLAAAIAERGDVHQAVWPASARRARVLHDYGLRTVLRLGPSATASFFDAFFDLDVAVWREYLRVDTTPRSVSRVMWGVFRRLPWSVRRQLVDVDPAVLGRLLRA